MRLGARGLAPLLLVAVTASAVPACRTAKLYNGPPVQFRASSPDQVEQAIMEAMRVQKWIAVKERPGLIRGTLNIRRHTAIVRVEYTASSYQIIYVDSSKLQYERDDDGSEVIHKNYNSWIFNLMREINARLP